MNAATRPGHVPRAELSLADYRRRVAELYAEVRRLPPPVGHATWVEGRNGLFATHRQSPIPPDRRDTFVGVPVFDYNPTLRFERVTVEPVEATPLRLPHSGSGTTSAYAFGAVSLDMDSAEVRLTLYWLDQYGGGVFLPFRDTTNGTDTYGGGRYLLDGAKGADLGSDDTSVTIDFNFAFHPSCVHDTKWSCPLSPPQNHLTVPIRGGEHL